MNLPSTTPEMRRSALFNSVTQNRTERGKILVEQQEFRDEQRADFRAVDGFVGVPRAARAQDG